MLETNTNLKNHSTLIDIFRVQGKSMNHNNNMFLLISNHDNENLTKNVYPVKERIYAKKTLQYISQNRINVMILRKPGD